MKEFKTITVQARESINGQRCVKIKVKVSSEFWISGAFEQRGRLNAKNASVTMRQFLSAAGGYVSEAIRMMSSRERAAFLNVFSEAQLVPNAKNLAMMDLILKLNAGAA